ncbi:FkbM family methyltransferase [Pseudomonas faucium]|uniref:FkbM family methyltransferase n=1 Tax=Pseudomonas faucium TaxID=2740518 RepID=UPI001F486515|nr:FkbM family methyltransferase [Pseudomonas faucium]
MRFVSYAQNYEDVMLWRALKNVQSGFYIDVGANDPVVDSVTKAFYDRGWKGINIEPLQAHYDALVEQRPLDVNLKVAAGEREGDIEIWDCGVRGWGTADESVMETHKATGLAGTLTRVPLYRLATLCESHAVGEINFLKIDVEGLEESVLIGMDFSRFRPWIVVVEATKPNSRVDSYSDWEHILLDQQYSLAYADGLNRFYVSDEKAELKNALHYPPNVFDEFIVFSQADAESERDKALERAQRAEESLVILRHKHKQLTDQEAQVSSELKSVYASHSWKVTAPFRNSGKALRNFFNLIMGR